MAEKILRFTAEEGNMSQVIDRLGRKLREAFSGSNLVDILDEADAKFKTFGEKVNYIREQLQQAAAGSKASYSEQLGRIDKSPNLTEAKRNRLTGQISREYQEEQREITRLIAALDKLSNQVERESTKQEKQSATDRVREDTAQGKGPGLIERAGEKVGGALGGTGIGAFLGTALGLIGGELALEFVKRIGGVLKEGADTLRTELRAGRQFTVGQEVTGIEGDYSLRNLAVTNKEFLDAVRQTAASRRTAQGAGQETLNRLALTGAYDVNPEQFQSLDRFFRIRPGTGDLLDRSQMDATRIIVEILRKSEQQGLLGLSKGDFTMLPEKIGQVQQVLAQQYQLGERTNAAEAVNLILSGQRIGGRFADDRAADTFNNLSTGISNARSPGMRAFILEALRRQNPNLTPLQLEGLAQQGATPENLQAIFPFIQRIQSRELRGRVLQGLGLDPQSALRLAESGNLQTLLSGATARPGTGQDLAATLKAAQDRAATLNLEQDKASTYFKNAVNEFGQWVNRLLNSGLGAGNRTFGAPAGAGTAPIQYHNKIIPANPAGQVSP